MNNEDMAAFDALPPELRAAYNYYPSRARSGQALEYLRAGHGTQTILSAMAQSTRNHFQGADLDFLVREGTAHHRRCRR